MYYFYKVIQKQIFNMHTFACHMVGSSLSPLAALPIIILHAVAIMVEASSNCYCNTVSATQSFTHQSDVI
jgi:hypothetical protein